MSTVLFRFASVCFECCLARGVDIDSTKSLLDSPSLLGASKMSRKPRSVGWDLLESGISTAEDVVRECIVCDGDVNGRRSKMSEVVAARGRYIVPSQEDLMSRVHLNPCSIYVSLLKLPNCIPEV